MSHLNGFEILVLFYILHDCISEVSDWKKIFHWIAREFKIVDDVMSTIIWWSVKTSTFHRLLCFCAIVLRYALYIPTIGKRRPGRPRTSYLNYVQRLLGDNEGAMQEQQIAAFADDRCAWRNLVVACSAADGWWWLCFPYFSKCWYRILLLSAGKIVLWKVHRILD